MPAILLDVLLVAVLIFFTLRGAKKGFVLTLCSLVAVVVALVAANLIAGAAAPMVAQAIAPTIEQTVTDVLVEQMGAVDAQVTTGIANALDALREQGGLLAGIADAIDPSGMGFDLVSYSPTIAQIAAQLATTVARQVAHGVLFLVGFVAALIAWWLISHALDLVAKLPVLSTLNDGLGGVIGLVKGVVIVYVAVWALYSLTGYVSPEMMEQTYLFKFLALHSPMELLMMKDLLPLPEPS